MRTVNECIDAVGVGRYQVIQLFVVNMLWLLDGAEILVASSILTNVSTIWNIPPWQKGLFISIIFVGVFIGNFAGGFLADRFGRKPAVLSAFAGVVVFGLASAAAQGPGTLLGLRFLFGISYGMGTSPAMTLLNETVPASWRGHMVNSGGLAFVLGEVFAAALLMVFMPQISFAPNENAWRYVTALSVAPGAVLFFVGLFTLRESPHYLAMKGRGQEAAAVLREMATINGRGELLQGLTEVHTPGAASQLVSAAGSSGNANESGTAPGPPRKEAVKEVLAAPAGAWQVLTSPDYSSIVVGGSYLVFVSNFVFFGLQYSFPQIFTHMDVPLSPAFQILITSLCDIPGVLLAWVLIRSRDVGHRDGLVALAILTSIGLLTMTSLDSGEAWMYVSLPAAYMSKYTISAFFTLSYAYLSEIFPSEVRGTALGMCAGVGRLGSISSPLVHDALTSGSVHWKYFVLAAAICAFAAVVIRSALHFEQKNQPLIERLAPIPEGRALAAGGPADDTDGC